MYLVSALFYKVALLDVYNYTTSTASIPTRHTMHVIPESLQLEQVLGSVTSGFTTFSLTTTFFTALMRLRIVKSNI